MRAIKAPKAKRPSGRWVRHGRFVDLRRAMSEGGSALAISTSRQGIPAKMLRGFAEHYHISNKRAYQLVGVSTATADRKIANDELLSQEASERLTRIAQIEAEAIDVLGSEALAHQWLDTPSVVLNGETPLEMVDTGYGADAVLRMLAAIRYGGVA